MLKKITLLTFLVLSFTSFKTVSAQELEAPNVEPIVTDFQHFYDEISRESLAKLYWRLGALDVLNNEHVDKFMFITECDIYKDYFFDEFEWESIRARAQNFLQNESQNFTVRYKFVQPLRLAEYDVSTGLFEVQEDFKVNGISKFEVLSSDIDEKLCSSFRSEIKHYPGALYVTLSQPFELTHIPMGPDRAKKYVNEKMEQFNMLNDGRRTRENLYKYRDAYLVMKIRFFDHRGVIFAKGGFGYYAAQVNAVLEGYEIYSDLQHTDLLYFENYLRKKETKPSNVRLKEQYEEMLRKRQEFSDR